MDRSTFLEHLKQSRLLSEQALELAARFPETASGRTMARTLTAEGLLTRYQARQLLAGKPKRLHLGKYRIVDLLGRGLTGPVYKAIHGTMERVVAIKVVLPRVLQDSLTVDLFLREVRAAAQLQHPGIVTAYDAGMSRGRHFLVMEYVEGPSLHNLVRLHGPLPVDLACELMRQTAEALQYSHEKGMVHRDIKPANLLVAYPSNSTEAQAQTSLVQTPVVKVIDFGLVRLHHVGVTGLEGTIKVEPGTVWGTIDYISPEQAEDIHAADIRSDLYSLGGTFYYALTGQVPFPGGTALEKLIKHIMQEPPCVRTLRPDVPPAVAAIIQRLLAKDRAHRFQTPAELAHELARLAPPGSPEEDLHEEDGLTHTTLSVEEEGSGEIFALPPTEAPSTVEDLLPCPVPTPRVDAGFLENWRRWTAVIEMFVRGQAHRYRVNPRMFHILRRRLMESCETRASSAVDEQRLFFLRLAALVKPWLTPDTLVRTDREILYSLLDLCQQAEQKLLKEMATPEAATEAGHTVLGGFLGLFKRRRE
jgi:serine/threonine protein kinase